MIVSFDMIFEVNSSCNCLQFCVMGVVHDEFCLKEIIWIENFWQMAPFKDI